MCGLGTHPRDGDLAADLHSGGTSDCVQTLYSPCESPEVTRDSITGECRSDDGWRAICEMTCGAAAFDAAGGVCVCAQSQAEAAVFDAACPAASCRAALHGTAALRCEAELTAVGVPPITPVVTVTPAGVGGSNHSWRSSLAQFGSGGSTGDVGLLACHGDTLVTHVLHLMVGTSGGFQGLYGASNATWAWALNRTTDLRRSALLDPDWSVGSVFAVTNPVTCLAQSDIVLFLVSTVASA